MKAAALETLATVLITMGVYMMIDGHDKTLWVYIVGVLLLTWGVRLAIDCGKRGHR